MKIEVWQEQMLMEFGDLHHGILLHIPDIDVTVEWSNINNMYEVVDFTPKGKEEFLLGYGDDIFYTYLGEL